MKRFLYVLLVSVMVSIFPLNAFAAESEEVQNITYFEDGSYLVETIETVQTRASGTKTGSKAHSFYNDENTMLWRAVLTGTFTYTGSSSTCTASNCSVTIYDSSWYTVSKSATKSGNTANAAVTMGEKLLGVTVRKVSTNIAISCDANGNLS